MSDFGERFKTERTVLRGYRNSAEDQTELRTDGTDPRDILGEETTFVRDFLKTLRRRGLPGSIPVQLYKNPERRRGYPIGDVGPLDGRGKGPLVFICDDARLRISRQVGRPFATFYDVVNCPENTTLRPGLAIYQRDITSSSDDSPGLSGPILSTWATIEHMPLHEALPKLAATLIEYTYFS
jgi:hypothetical protein